MVNITSPILDLSAELRLRVYESVLDNIFQTVKHPHDPAPKYGDYVSLLSLNKQIHDEVEDFFRKIYANRTTFYFAIVPQLRRFVYCTRDFPKQHDLWFNIGSGREIQPSLSNRLLGGSQEGLLRFVANQRCLRVKWSSQDWPEFHLATDGVVQTTGARSWIPNVKRIRFLPLDHDQFQIKGVLDDADPTDKALIPHESLTYAEYYSPQHRYRASLRLLEYCWIRTAKSVPYVASHVFEGKLGELVSV